MHASLANICMHNNPLQVGDLFMLFLVAFLQTKCIFKCFKLHLLIDRLLLQQFRSIYVAQLCSKHTLRIVVGLQTANPCTMERQQPACQLSWRCVGVCVRARVCVSALWLWQWCTVAWQTAVNTLLKRRGLTSQL